MDRDAYIKLLYGFVDGKTSLTELSEVVDERLFELRRHPSEVNEEEDFLSGIELILCEVEDGFRTIQEFEEYVKALILPKRPDIIVWDGKNDMPIITSTSSNRNVSGVSIGVAPIIRDYPAQAVFG